MGSFGVCCASLKDNKALMKMGLGLVLVGHINFILGGLVHGAVLRNIKALDDPRIIVYAISNIIVIVAGLVGIIGGIIAIILSKNKRNKILQWVLLVFSFLTGLLSSACIVGLSVSAARAIINRGSGLMAGCTSSGADHGSSSLTYECPFDYTRIYTTTIILWVLLISMSMVEMVFSFRCFAACTSFLYLCPCRKQPIRGIRPRSHGASEAASMPRERDLESDAEAEPAEHIELLEDTAAQHSSWL